MASNFIREKLGTESFKQGPETTSEPSELVGVGRLEIRRRGPGLEGAEGNLSDDHRTWLLVDSIPGYRIKALLGRGGMGEVFLATHNDSGLDVALKLLARPSYLARRFERETQLAGRLEHPHIVKAIDAGSVEHFSYLAMEHIKGCNLAQLVARRGPLESSLVIEVLRQALRALVHIHSLGIIHRDIKPANFMLSEAGCVKMLDLGLAKQYLRDEDDSVIQTVTQHLISTAAYASPEQGFNTSAVCPASDIYSLGCTAYFLLAGKHPFKGETAIATFVMHRDAPIPEVVLGREHIDPQLAHCIQRMMAKHPHDRPTAVELLDKCEQQAEVSLSGIAIATPPSQLFAESDFALTSVLTFDEQTTSTPNSKPAKGSKRAKAFYVAASALPLAVLLFVLWSASSRAYKLSDLPKRSSRLAEGSSNWAEPPTSVPVLHALSPLQAELLDKYPGYKQSLTELPENFEITDVRLQAILQELKRDAKSDRRTALIHLLPAFVPLQKIVDLLRNSMSPDTCAACVQMLGVYEPLDVEARLAFDYQKGELYQELLQLYLTDPDPEVHSSLLWLATRWQWDRKWDAFRPYLQQKVIPFSGGWYQPPVAPTMVVLLGPRDAELGSLMAVVGLDETLARDELARNVHLPHTFAVSVIEVTKELMWRVSSERLKARRPADGQIPVNAIQWSEAALFCNELSQMEGIPPSEFCYEVKINGDRIEAREVPDALERSGYRLPTDDEWEIACRADTTTIRPHGEEIGWLPEYSNCFDPTADLPILCPVAQRKPNGFGLFDMIGNISEWTNDLIYINNERKRRLRGGSVWTPHEGLRSAARYNIAERMPKAHERTGFRVARTVRKEPLNLPTGLKLQVGILNLLSAAPLSSSPDNEIKGLPSEFFQDQIHFESVTDAQPWCLGDWPLGNVPPKRFRLLNDGAVPLEINPLPLQDTSFKLDQPPVSVLLPSRSTEFSVRCNENFTGAHVLALQLEITPLGQPASLLSLQIPVYLEGSRIVFENVTEAAPGRFDVDLGEVPVGALVGRKFQFLNAGNLQTIARVIATSGECEITRNVMETLVPGKREWFHINLRAEQPGEVFGNAIVHSSQGSGAEFEINLHANAIVSNRFKLPGVFRAGNWIFNHSSDGKSMERIQFGEPTGIPFTGDWDRNGQDDLAVCHQDTVGTWHWSLKLREPNPTQRPSSPSLNYKTDFVWGENQHRPLVADINGDGRTDFGLVSLKLPTSAEGQLQDSLTEFIAEFDVDGDQVSDIEKVLQWESRTPVSLNELSFLSGDVDGDKTDDLIITRIADAESSARRWKICFSDGLAQNVTFGLSSVTPIVGDFNADGHSDLGTAEVVDRTLIFQLNLDLDQYPDLDIRRPGNSGDIPITLSP